MKIHLIYIFSLILIFTAVETSQAQFEGKVVYNTYEIDSGGEKTAKDQFTMFVTSDRILLQGENKYDFIGNIKTEGVLVRLDFKDFVFLTGNSRALKISKSDIDSMFNMFGDNNKGSVSGIEEDVSFRKTADTRTINGYKCEKFLFTDQDDKESHAEVWMTKELAISWGMLAEPWGGQAEALISAGFPFSLIFEEGYFPLKMDSYRDGKLKMVTEIEDLRESTIARAMVQVPSGVTVLSFQDYLFQQLSDQ